MRAERVFADTNVFLRYLTNDLPEQADAVEELLRQAAGGAVVLVTNNLVLAEIVWTLESYYRLSREDIREKVLAIINTPGIELPEKELALTAIICYTEEGVDYADAFNAAWLLSQGLSAAYTFDRKHFARLNGIEVRVPGD